MEKILRQLFDFQRFAGNERLEILIKQAEASYERALSDEDKGLVNAAGEPESRRGKKGFCGDDE